MAIVNELNQAYVDHQLRCPEGKQQFEIVDPQRTGLYILVRATNQGEGTYYLRHKVAGKTQHIKIGGTGEMTLESAREATIKLKSQRKHVSAGALMEPSPGVAVIVVPAASAAPTPTDAMTLDAFMTDLYFPHAKAHKRSWTRDEQLYRIRIKPKFGHVPMAQITRKAVNQFKIALLGEGLANASVNHHIQLMRHVFNLAVSWEALDRNVLAGIELLHLDNQVEHYLDDEAVDGFIKVAKEDGNRNVCMILLFLLSTGARLGEALGAQWSQLDLANRLWKIPATNSKSKRMKHLPINDSALWVIERLASQGTSAYLFPSPASGKPYTTITRAWYRIRKKAGIADDVRIHDLRHTFASRVVSRGQSLLVAQKLLGHRDARTTLRYAHLSQEAMREGSNAAALALA